MASITTLAVQVTPAQELARKAAVVRPPQVKFDPTRSPHGHGRGLQKMQWGISLPLVLRLYSTASASLRLPEVGIQGPAGH
jgi:hypothetical protein